MASAIREQSRLDDFRSAYFARIVPDSEDPITVEYCAHGFGWEGYHSPLNAGGGTLIPSRAFSEYFNQHSCPQTFAQKLPDGTFASQTFECSDGYSGDFLFLREDLVNLYAKGRSLVWVIWGERGIYPFEDHWKVPESRRKAYQNYEHIWQIRQVESLSPLFASSSKKRRLVKKSVKYGPDPLRSF